MKKNAYFIMMLSLLLTLSLKAANKPLKVYILAGQSNMEGQAKVRTIGAMRDDVASAELYNEMTNKEEKPTTVKDVYIAYGKRSGKLDATYGAVKRSGGPRLGPEFTFGIYMKKSVNEPILLIKTAWGGKDLLQQFRPPSAGDFEKKEDRHGNKTGHYYRLMMQEVNDVLANLGKYHPAYNKKAGHEVAGLVWFQGYNDQFGNYPKIDPNDKKSVKDFSEYSRLMACFIRDVRKDLSAPKMKFVIGAIGIGGQDASKIKGIPKGKYATFISLQRAQAAPASMPEFKDSVGVVYTAKYWDHELSKVSSKLSTVSKKFKGRTRNKKLSKDESKAMHEALMNELLTEEERKMSSGISDGDYHYLGSAKIYGKIGKAFAESMIKLEKK